MIQVERIETTGWRAALRGMRNPMDSWSKSDTQFWNDNVVLGAADARLAWALVTSGTDHAKFLRMITVHMDINAPLYWWKEWDTYKVGTVANSCSTMHTFGKRPVDISDFSHDHMDEATENILELVIDQMNAKIDEWRETGDKEAWYAAIQLMPNSWNQLRTVQLNYQVLTNMYWARRNHKQQEWRDLIEALVEELPYSWLFTQDYEAYDEYMNSLVTGDNGST